ncbi:MAG: phosphoenolpyruvate kinase, partial [Acidobacteria bacterium]|nr:phosphoenolpyruvate kinase [Acidobacteriota bacterium]
MKRSLSDESRREATRLLEKANLAIAERYPGETGRRQPVHTVYGGAHLFKADSAQRLGALALRSLEQYGPDFTTFSRAINLPGTAALPETSSAASELSARLEAEPERIRQENKPAWLAHTIYARVLEKLRREPVEDFRIDFEDGYGNRPDAEEDGHGAAAARETARGLANGTLPPFIGIRIKPFTEELRERSIRTLDIFVSTLVDESGGRLPDNFVVTLPKITIPEQVAALADLFDALESATALAPGSLKMEMMVETTQSIINERGESSLPLLLEAARGRC